METKHDRFVRLAESRTNNVLKQIHLIGNLSNKRNYEYSKEEIDEIFKAINKAVKNAKDQFDLEVGKNNGKFTLK